MTVAMWTSWETRCGIAAYTGSLVAELRARGVEVEIVPVPYTDREPAAARERLDRLNAADVVHIQHEYTFFGGVAPGVSSLPGYYAKLRRPVVLTAHTVFSAAELLRLPQETRPRQRLAKRLLSAYPPYRRYVERDPFRPARAVIVHTAEARQRLLARGLRPGQVHVIPAGIPAREAASPEEVRALRERLGWDDRGRVLTLFGYVTPEKGYDTALDALKSLPPAARLLIAGGTRVPHEAPYLDSLRASIREAGLEGRVAISGYLEPRELAAAMALTDVVLVPHHAANGSYSVMVALGYGKPVLASDLACFREIRDDGGCVELFDPGDERMLAERAGFLLASESARKGLARAAEAYAKRRSWSAVAEQTLAVYRQAAGEGGR